MLEVINLDSTAKKYSYNLSSLTERELRKDFSEMWKCLIQHIQADRQSGTWNRLIFEFWLEEGYILCFPQKGGESPDKHMPEIVIGLDLLAETIDKASNLTSEEDIQNLFYVAQAIISTALDVAYRKEPALTAIKELVAKNMFTCYKMRDNKLDTAIEMVILY